MKKIDYFGKFHKFKKVLDSLNISSTLSEPVPRVSGVVKMVIILTIHIQPFQGCYNPDRG